MAQRTKPLPVMDQIAARLAAIKPDDYVAPAEEPLTKAAGWCVVSEATTGIKQLRTLLMQLTSEAAGAAERMAAADNSIAQYCSVEGSRRFEADVGVSGTEAFALDAAADKAMVEFRQASALKSVVEALYFLDTMQLHPDLMLNQVQIDCNWAIGYRAGAPDSWEKIFE